MGTEAVSYMDSLDCFLFTAPIPQQGCLGKPQGKRMHSVLMELNELKWEVGGSPYMWNSRERGKRGREDGTKRRGGRELESEDKVNK